MHYLHKILVCTSTLESDTDDDIRDYAESETKWARYTVYDYRETDSAGRWSDVYPNNVIRVKDNPNTSRALLESVIQSQKNDIEFNVDWHLKDFSTESIKKIVDSFGKDEDSQNGMLPYALKEIADILSGTYRCNSMFYNTGNGSSKLTYEEIEKIMDNAENFAIVLFDIHA